MIYKVFFNCCTIKNMVKPKTIIKIETINCNTILPSYNIVQFFNDLFHSLEYPQLKYTPILRYFQASE